MLSFLTTNYLEPSGGKSQQEPCPNSRGCQLEGEQGPKAPACCYVPGERFKKMRPESGMNFLPIGWAKQIFTLQAKAFETHSGPKDAL